MVCSPVRSIIHKLKLVDYLSVQADNHALSSIYCLITPVTPKSLVSESCIHTWTPESEHTTYTSTRR